MKTPIPDEFEISSIVYSIVSDICSQIHTQAAEHVSFAAVASRYILIHIDEKFNLDTFSQYMNMSKFYFCRKFKEEFSCSPFEYIQQQKINKAKRILIFTSLSISEIAYNLAFYDQSHFCKVFTRLTGVSPNKFRKTYSKI